MACSFLTRIATESLLYFTANHLMEALICTFVGENVITVE